MRTKKEYIQEIERRTISQCSISQFGTREYYYFQIDKKHAFTIMLSTNCLKTDFTVIDKKGVEHFQLPVMELILEFMRLLEHPKDIEVMNNEN